MTLLQRVAPLSALLLGSALLPVSGIAQLSFQGHTVANAAGVGAHGDFNNDGREDIVTDQLYLSNGDGTYQTPKPLPATVSAIGDFNRDGKLDFVYSKGDQTSPLAVYLGNGDGTFQSPRIITGSSAYRVVAADLNRDGKTDIATVTTTNTGNGYPTTIQIWLGNGDGTFSKGQTITTTNPADPLVQFTEVFAGDFDGDGKADIALVYSFIGPTTVQVWYGDGAGHLGTPSALTDPNNYLAGSITAGDVNNDGRSDIVTNDGTAGPRYGDFQPLPKLSFFIGNANRTLGYTTIATTQCALKSPVIADFNGDGLNDLAYGESACDQSSANTNFVVAPGAGAGSFRPEQTIYQNLTGTSQPLAVRTTTGTKPDLIFGQTSGQNGYATVLLTNTSSGAFPGCGLSGFAEGVAICAPGASASSPVRFSVGAAGPTPMRTAAVWVDGKKVTEQLAHAFSNYSFLDASVPLAAGNHAVTVYGVGWDDTLQQKSFTLHVAGSGTSCSAPSTAGVNVCAPVTGSTVASPVQVVASSTITGTLARMEVWVDGVKKYSETTSKSLNTSLALAAGSHRFDVYAVNKAGTKLVKTVTATVK